VTISKQWEWRVTVSTTTEETIMAGGIKDKAAEAGHKIAETAKTVGHKIAEGAEKAAGWVKEKTHVGADKGCDTTKMALASEKTPSTIREHMEVIASCGKHVGLVDRIEGNSIKLTQSDPSAAGKHHFIPLDWVGTVDQHVHLNKNSEEVFRDWKSESTVDCCGG
jgi:hypothetical protein